MESYTPRDYSEPIAEIDEWYGDFDLAAIDGLARLAGLRLLNRWGGRGGAPFSGASGTHILVYGR